MIIVISNITLVEGTLNTQNESLSLLARVIDHNWGACTSRLCGTLGSLVLVCNTTGLLVDIEYLL